MRRLFYALILCLCTLVIQAQPLLVGHRGSGYGVENTEEAFRKGANLGYQYVETDIKVTKDTKFVLTHDDNLSRFGHENLVIASSTLEQLQAVTLTQTRSSVTYTGKLMELGEFLDLCTELNVLPVIELKWGTGVNSNDQSNMPALVKVIQDKGYYDKAIILTSMKPCLEWLHKNHPDIQLQLLISSSPANHLEWCKKNNADIDMEASVCTDASVDMYHEAGIKVNMWTTNTESGYQTYATMGCDFITTDRLDGNNLPDYEPKVVFPTIEGDYPDELSETTLQPEEEYTFNQAYLNEPIALLEGKTIRRVVPYNDLVYILALDAEKKPTILIIDPITKQTTEVSTAGMVQPTKVSKADENRLLSCSDIQVSQEGVLVATNLAETTTDKIGEFTVYKWNNDENNLPVGDPTIWIKSQADGGFTNAYAGSTFAYSGTVEKGNIYVSVEAVNSTANIRIAAIPIIDGTATPRAFSQTTPPARGFMKVPQVGEDYRFTLSPLASDHVIVTGSGQGCVLASFQFNKKSSTTATEIPDNLNIPTNITHISFFKYAGAVYATLPTEEGAVLLDITDGLDKATIVTTKNTTLTSSTEIAAAAGQIYFDKETNKADIDILLLRGTQSNFLTTRAQTNAVEDIQMNTSDQVTFYTITGTRISKDNLTTGIYIRKQGNKATKIIIP